MVMYSGTKEKKPNIDRKHPPARPLKGPLKGRLSEEGTQGISGSPLVPRIEEHRALLSQASSDTQRSAILLRLQQTYGNSYVQRLLGSTSIQAKPGILPPPEIAEPEVKGPAKKGQKPPLPKKTYYENRSQELEKKGGKPGIFGSVEYRLIVNKTRQFYESKENAPHDYKRQWTLVNSILNTIRTWWNLFRIFSRKVRREALTRLEERLVKERAWLVPRVTARSLVSSALLEKNDVPEHREGMILEYCLKRWQAENEAKKNGISWDLKAGPPPPAFYEYVNQLEKNSDKDLLKEVHGKVYEKAANPVKDADAWIAQHQKDKKYIPRILYVPKEDMNRRKIKFNGKEAKFETTSEPLAADKNYIYVMNPRGDFFVESEDRTTQLKFHHSSLLAGEEVAAAGHLKVGNSLYLDLESGHYQPTMQHMYNAVKALKDKNVDLGNTQIKATYEAQFPIRALVFLEGIFAMKAGKSEKDARVKAFVDSYIRTQEGGAGTNMSKEDWLFHARTLKKMVAELKV
jgi:hypothetical protein